MYFPNLLLYTLCAKLSKYLRKNVWNHWKVIIVERLLTWWRFAFQAISLSSLQNILLYDCSQLFHRCSCFTDALTSPCDLLKIGSVILLVLLFFSINEDLNGTFLGLGRNSLANNWSSRRGGQCFKIHSCCQSILVLAEVSILEVFNSESHRRAMDKLSSGINVIIFSSAQIVLRTHRLYAVYSEWPWLCVRRQNLSVNPRSWLITTRKLVVWWISNQKHY